VAVVLRLAGSPGQQEDATEALVTYLTTYMQEISGQDVVVMSPEAPEQINRQRILQSVPAPVGLLCTADAPQTESSIDLRNYNDVVRV
jgi:hypothetical protein